MRLESLGTGLEYCLEPRKNKFVWLDSINIRNIYYFTIHVKAVAQTLDKDCKTKRTQISQQCTLLPQFVARGATGTGREIRVCKTLQVLKEHSMVCFFGTVNTRSVVIGFAWNLQRREK